MINPMKKMVSVIMPVYNAEIFLNQSIQSVISQTYQDWELLVVDDCSNDNSVIVITSVPLKWDELNN